MSMKDHSPVPTLGGRWPASCIDWLLSKIPANGGTNLWSTSKEGHHFEEVTKAISWSGTGLWQV
jgi:hypothetical protein